MIRLRTTAIAAGLLLASTAAFAGKDNKNLELSIQGADGGDLSFSISADFVDSIFEGLAGAKVDCDVTTDRETLAMLEHLDHRGVGSRYRFETDDGQTIKARRSKHHLELRVLERGEEPVRVELPWAIAECMMGREGSASLSGGSLSFSAEKEGGFSISID